ncbi:MAG TPA: hypothetical protein VFP68_06820, partial [Burkholderiaceae bacterium]|nr:hypothetical protein [Burkholderiaceae bacterium]
MAPVTESGPRPEGQCPVPSTSATRRSPIKAEEELQKYIAEGPKVFRRNEYQAFADLRRLSGFGDSLKKTILGNESLRYRELERKVEEATKCAIQIDGGIPNWYRPSVDDDNLLKIFPFLPPELRRKILADITPRYTWQLAFKARHLLSRSELEPLIEMGNYETQIRLCRQKDGAACFSKLQLIRLVHIACGIADRQKRADAIADMGRALPHLD